jgi:hypothetical protein
MLSCGYGFSTAMEMFGIYRRDIYGVYAGIIKKLPVRTVAPLYVMRSSKAPCPVQVAGGNAADNSPRNKAALEGQGKFFCYTARADDSEIQKQPPALSFSASIELKHVFVSSSGRCPGLLHFV